MELLQKTVTGLQSLFYLRPPSSTYVAPLEQPENIVADGIPVMTVLILLEALLSHLRGRKQVDLADATVSMSQGLAQEAVRYALRGCEGWAYVWIWKNWRWFDVPWGSPVSFWLTMLAVDMGYYWFHRAAHEVNIVWASHQVHHSSEHYNLSTAFRQSMVQQYFSWVVYLPLAFLGVAPSMFFTHSGFNLLFQFWLHTEMVSSVGPLEHILNTPSHHRVHHGSNVKYLDKNYAGVLIIWDRLFGTFCWEEETPTYGLVHNIESYDLWTIQTAHFRWIWADLGQQVGWRNKLKRVFFGPGWVPGTARLGDPTTFPEPDPARPRFDTAVPGWVRAYAVLHFLVIMVPSADFAQRHLVLPVPAALLYSGALIVAITCLGWLLDGAARGPLAELLRCAGCLAALPYLAWLPPPAAAAARLLFAGSALLWVFRGALGAAGHKIAAKKAD